MHLAKVRIKNFRCYNEEIQLELDDLTAIIGRNDAGKSTILDALDIFFGNVKVEQSDGSVEGEPSQLAITCEFDELPAAIIIDETNETSLPAEYLLNEDGRLEWTVIYNASLKSPGPKPKEEYLTAVHPSAKNYSDLLFLKNGELKDRLAELKIPDGPIDKRINAQMRIAIWNSVSEHELQLSSQRLPISQLDGGSGRKISEKLKQQRPMYFLFRADRPGTDQDSEAQDPMKKAVQAAMDAKARELGDIADFVEQEVSQVASATLAKLHEIDVHLAEDLCPVLDNPRWHNAFKVGLVDDAGISLNKRGSGIRRLVLLSFLQAQAEIRQAEEQRTAIFAVEEPETSLHPDLQRQLYSALESLSHIEATQVLVTTHTPTLGSLLPTKGIRYLEVTSDRRRVVHASSDIALQKAAQALGVHQIATVKLMLGLEGPNDMDCFRKISRVLAQAGENVPDIQELEAEAKLILYPFGGSTLGRWIQTFQALNLPEIIITDRDYQMGPAKYQELVDEFETEPNREAYITSKRELENYLHQDAVNAEFNIKITVGDWDDVPKKVAQATGKNESKIKLQLNNAGAARMTSDLLSQRDPNDDIRRWLSRIGEIVSG